MGNYPPNRQSACLLGEGPWSLSCEGSPTVGGAGDRTNLKPPPFLLGSHPLRLLCLSSALWQAPVSFSRLSFSFLPWQRKRTTDKCPMPLVTWGLFKPLFLHLLMDIITPTDHAGGRCKPGAEYSPEGQLCPPVRTLLYSSFSLAHLDTQLPPLSLLIPSPTLPPPRLQ